GHDLQFHIANAYEYRASLDEGILVAHHAPHYFAGLGGINFKYYPPYAYLPVATLLSLGVSLASAFALALGLSFLVSGLGMYCWARIYHERPGALLCAVLYMAAPYHLDDLFRRFAYPELWGMALDSSFPRPALLSTLSPSPPAPDRG
ncbi:MAG: hypothetical protein JXQ29_15655, partial [Planctomycetes bacterium]|nr:hypothetical protein [Planctomycetota bacterium]